MTLLVIPLYKREDLVPRLFANLEANVQELRQLGIEILLINDSPEYPALAESIDSYMALLEGVPVRLLENTENLGFVRSCNRAFETAVKEERDVILLNSDCLITPGALTEVISVSQIDEKIAFVCPRSNNASIASLPNEAQKQNLSSKVAFDAFSRVFQDLPRFTYAPTAVGFCFLAKWQILSDFGFFDEIYGKGYQEENDLVLRANKAGYRAVLANHAFVWHEGSQSFKVAKGEPKKRDAKNLQILTSRYPYYLKLVQRFMNSPERRAEELLVEARLRDKPLVVFDFTHIGTYFNGTFEAALQITRNTVATANSKFKFGIMVDIPAWHFHGLDKWVNVFRIDPADDSLRAAAIIRIGQPFTAAQLNRVFSRGAVSVIYMLDTIAMDCGQNSLEFDVSIWDKTMKYASAVLAISNFTKIQLELRFNLGANTALDIAYLSLDTNDYYTESNSESQVKESYVFVVGNSFPHKFVDETCDYLLANTNLRIAALGHSGGPSDNPRLQSISSGSLTEHEIEELWRGSSAVIFPSHYEGFGLPVLHALARRKPIFTRDNILNQELREHLGGNPNVHLYSTSSELVEKMSRGLPDWIESVKSNVKPYSWMASADFLIETLKEQLEKLTYEGILGRTKSSLYDLSPNYNAGLSSPAALLGRKLELFIETLLRIPFIKKIATAVYRILKKLS